MPASNRRSGSTRRSRAGISRRRRSGPKRPRNSGPGSRMNPPTCDARSTSSPVASARAAIPVSGMRRFSAWKPRLRRSASPRPPSSRPRGGSRTSGAPSRKVARARIPRATSSTWFRRVLPRLPRSAFQGKAGDALHAIWSLVEVSAVRPPDGLDPARLPPTDDLLRTIELLHDPGGLASRPFPANPPVLESKSTSEPPGSPVGLIRLRHPRIKAESFTDRPTWASEWGEDRYGFWSAFRMKGVRQRLRWIPAGEFMMGSPDEEAGRYDDEGPQHPVRISRGFWLCDKPCTQALWEAVMDENPSHFRSPTRPVEQVSWKDCQTFFMRLSGLAGGLMLSLPSEAQWEYACRAGSTTRYSFGDEETQLGDHSWFSDNSAGETHDVSGKAAE